MMRAQQNWDQHSAELPQQSQQCKPNMTKDQKLALKKLAEDKDIVILPANKGNATVVLNKEGYNQKMNDLLKDASYK